MRVTVNGEGTEVPDQTTARALIELLGLAGGPVAIELNGEVLPRAEHASTGLKQGDVVELVHFVGGG